MQCDDAALVAAAKAEEDVLNELEKAISYGNDYDDARADVL